MGFLVVREPLAGVVKQQYYSQPKQVSYAQAKAHSRRLKQKRHIGRNNLRGFKALGKKYDHR